MKIETTWFVVSLIAVLLVGGLLGATIFPTEKLVDNQVLPTADNCAPFLPDCIALGYFESCPEVNITTEKESCVSDIDALLDEAFDYSVEEGWDDLKYCDGDKYYKDEVEFNLDKYKIYVEEDFTKVVQWFEAEYDADDPGYRCDVDYKVIYTIDDDDDQTLNIIEV